MHRLGGDKIEIKAKTLFKRRPSKEPYVIFSDVYNDNIGRDVFGQLPFPPDIILCSVTTATTATGLRFGARLKYVKAVRFIYWPRKSKR